MGKPTHHEAAGFGPRAVILWGLLALSITGLYGPLLARHARSAADPSIFNDDVRQQIPPFFRYKEPRLREKDYLGSYYLANFPLGYRTLYSTAARISDPVRLSERLPYVLLACAVGFLALTAHRLGGPLAAWGSVALCLASSVYLAKTAGGLPRGFALPILATFSTMLSHGRIRLAAVVVWIGALFYPVAGFCSGVALALCVVLLPSRARGEASSWPLPRRLLFLAATALAAALVLVPVALSASRYGPVVGPDAIDEFPEAGLGGRYSREIVFPYPGVSSSVWGVVEDVALGAGPSWIETTGRWTRTGRGRAAWTAVVLLIAGVGWLRLVARNTAAQRFLMLLPAALLTYQAAKILAPHLYVPHRYLFYPATILATVMIPTGFVGLVRRPDHLWRGIPRGTIAVGLGCAALLLLGGGRGDPKAGLRTGLVDNDPVYRALAELPPDSLVAGWPRGLMDNVPLVTKRAVFLNYESHQAFHRDFVLELRRRMAALVAAYFSTSPEPIVRLREDWGVTHLVVDRRILTDRSVSYFKPFREIIAKARRQAGAGPYEVLRQAEDAAIFQHGDVAVLDLSRIREHADPPVSANGQPTERETSP